MVIPIISTPRLFTAAAFFMRGKAVSHQPSVKEGRAYARLPRFGCMAHLLLSKDLGYIAEADFESLTSSIQEIKRMLTSLLKTVREQVRN